MLIAVRRGTCCELDIAVDVHLDPQAWQFAGFLY